MKIKLHNLSPHEFISFTLSVVQAVINKNLALYLRLSKAQLFEICFFVQKQS